MTDPGRPGQPYGNYDPQQGGYHPQGGYGSPGGYDQQGGYNPQEYQQGGYPPQPDPYAAPSPYDVQNPYQQYPAADPYQQPANQYQPPAQYQPPTPYGPYTPGGPAPAPPKKGNGMLIGVVIGVVVLVLGLCGAGIYFFSTAVKNSPSNNTGNGPVQVTPTLNGTPYGGTRTPGPTTGPTVRSTDPADATVGSCLAGDTLDSASARPVNNMEIVDCSASNAKYKVVGVVPGKTKAQFNAENDTCDAYPSAKSELWEGTSSGSGVVLCLAPK